MYPRGEGCPDILLDFRIYQHIFGYIRDGCMREESDVSEPEIWVKDVWKREGMYSWGDNDVLSRGEWCIQEGIFELFLNNRNFRDYNNIKYAFKVFFS